ncbi:MAG: hypothetical protein WCI88_12040 [Chloroflexota bacterium]
MGEGADGDSTHLVLFGQVAGFKYGHAPIIPETKTWFWERTALPY